MRLVVHLLALIRALTADRARLALENVALRHQLNVLRRNARRPKLEDTGARKGEILRLRWRDVCFESGTISLYRPKVSNFSRIPMHPALAEELRQIRDSRPKAKDSDAVFLSRLGTPYKDFKEAFGTAVRRAGLQDRGVTAHCLRHSFACHFLENGAAVTDLPAVLGHASLVTTQIYARMVDRRTRSSVEALDFGASP